MQQPLRYILCKDRFPSFRKGARIAIYDFGFVFSPDSKFLHERLNPLHWDHHKQPFDGMHISGGLKDILPLFFVAAPVSFLFPVYTAPAVLAGAVQSYACEEWLHYALHFSNSRFPLFRRVKKYHLYHHSPRGIDKGYGITTRFWDGVFDTRFPRSVRRSLSRN